LSNIILHSLSYVNNSDQTSFAASARTEWTGSDKKAGSPRDGRSGCGEFPLTGRFEFAGGEIHRRAKWHHNWSPEDVPREEKSSAGQDEMTVTREQPMARQATALSGRQAGNPHASTGRPARIPLLFS